MGYEHRDPTRQRVSQVMADVSRADFLPTSARDRADVDAPVRIGFGQTNSQPRTVANMLELLQAREGQRILDVGSGSGWTTALLGELVGPKGRVIGVELVPELVERSQAALSLRGREWVEVRHALAGTLGWPEDAPFDRILVSAEAKDVPRQLVEQLAKFGRMVIPVRQRMLLVIKGARGLKVTAHGAYVFVPLIEE